MTQPMYPGQVNSPSTELANEINNTQTTIVVADGSILPSAPNLATIGVGDGAETILYASKTGNELSGITRGFQGTGKAWGAGTKIRRLFTAYDWDSIRVNHIEHISDYVRQPGYAVTAGTGNAYTVTTDPAPTAYVDGMGIVIRANRTNTGASTLNWNGLGAVPIVDAKGNPLIAGKIPNGARLSLRYSSAAGNFQLQGEGGEYGTATPAEVMQGYTIGTEEGVVPGTLTLSGNAAAGDVIAGQTFYNTNPKSKITGTLALTGDAAAAQVLSGRTFYNTNPKSRLTGTMANRGAVTNTITTQGGQYTIPQGYHSGSGVVTASFPNLIPGNVKQGVNIGGVVGTLPPGIAGTATINSENISVQYDQSGDVYTPPILVFPNETVSGFLQETGASKNVVTFRGRGSANFNFVDENNTNIGTVYYLTGEDYVEYVVIDSFMVTNYGVQIVTYRQTASSSPTVERRAVSFQSYSKSAIREIKIRCSTSDNIRVSSGILAYRYFRK